MKRFFLILVACPVLSIAQEDPNDVHVNTFKGDYVRINGKNNWKAELGDKKALRRSFDDMFGWFESSDNIMLPVLDELLHKKPKKQESKIGKLNCKAEILFIRNPKSSYDDDDADSTLEYRWFLEIGVKKKGFLKRLRNPLTRSKSSKKSNMERPRSVNICRSVAASQERWNPDFSTKNDYRIACN